MEVFVTKFQEFTLFFSRMLATLSITPFFATQSFSFSARVAISFLTGIIVTSTFIAPTEFASLINQNYFNLILQQVFIGLFLGVTLQFLFAAFQMAGEFFSIQIGFSITEVFDPLSETSIPLMGNLNNLMGLLVFFVSGAYLKFVEAVVFSYQKMPYILDYQKMHTDLLNFFIMISSSMFLIALNLAMPIMGTLLLTSVTLGILSKAAPQMNILMLGFPLKILIGFLVLVFVSPIIIDLMYGQFEIYLDHLNKMIQKFSL